MRFGKKILQTFTAAILAVGVAGAASAASVKIGYTQGSSGNINANINNIVADRADGSTNAGIVGSAAWNAGTGADMAALYDVIVFGWSSGSHNTSWAKMTDYMNAGGKIIWEWANGGTFSSEAASGVVITGSGYGATDSTISGPFAGGIADGVGSYINGHHRVSSFNASMWTEWLSDPTGTIGLYGLFGAGAMITSGPDNFYHGVKGGSAAAKNQYNLAYNQIEWLSSLDVAPVPLPASLPLLIAGIGGMVALRRRKKS